MIEQRISKQPRPRPLAPKDVIKRIPQCPADIGVSVPIATSELTKQGHLKFKYLKLTPGGLK
jgi:hypothetical protein